MGCFTLLIISVIGFGTCPGSLGKTVTENPERQFYNPYGAPYNPYQQFNPYTQYQPGFPDPNFGFLRPPVPPTVATTTAATTAATTTTATTTTTTTTGRPLQPGVTTRFPLVGPGTGFQRPGNQNILPGQPAFGNFGFGQYPFFQGKK